MTASRSFIGRPGDPPQIVIKDGATETPLPPFPGDTRPLGWDDMNQGGAGSTALAKAILFQVLADEIKATEFHMRFKHRVIRNFKKDNPWSLSEAEVLETVGAIRSAAVAMAPGVQQAVQTPSPVVSDVGGGPGGAPIEWDKVKKELPDEAKSGAKNTNKTDADSAG